jgi:hypothetical protein
MLNERAKLGPKIEKKIDELLDLIEEDMAVTRRIMPAWAWSNSDREVLKPFGQGIRELLCYAFYKKSAQRFMGNVGGNAITLPGSVCERMEWRLQPDKIPSLADRLREIAEYGSRVMRGGKPIIERKAS